jgi:hypothetical protein
MSILMKIVESVAYLTRLRIIVSRLVSNFLEYANIAAPMYGGWGMDIPTYYKRFDTIVRDGV